MKKIIFFIILIYSCKVNSETFIEGKHYIKLPHRIKNATTITEYFSFNCRYCYQLKKELNLYSNLNNNVKINSYHLEFFKNKQEKILTHMWSIAKLIHAEKKIILPIFEFVNKKKNEINFKTIKKIFIKKTKISNKEYDKLWKSYSVLNAISENKKQKKKVYLSYVPQIIINGKYLILTESLNTDSIKNFILEYTNIIKYLIKK
ncbi:Thiol:disulfide interchange protein DsbA [Buchnera aphidicola (Tetraneura ulmi)]|uniref:DsbA family protein n=1 Tax=Buchnera aphidicola TaxID=9 RepID=UPI003464BA1E